MIAVCGVICGAEGWGEIEEFGKAKAAWFGSWLALPNGIPSHDTFGRVFARIDPKQFEACFLHWVQSVSEEIKGVIAVDGKTLRRSHDRAGGKKALHLVSAWAADQFAQTQHESHRTVQKGHGRIEIREYWTITDPAILTFLDAEHRWKELQGIGMVRAERRKGRPKSELTQNKKEYWHRRNALYSSISDTKEIRQSHRLKAG